MGFCYGLSVGDKAAHGVALKKKNIQMWMYVLLWEFEYLMCDIWVGI